MYKPLFSIFFFFIILFSIPAYAAFPIEYNKDIDVTHKNIGFKLSQNSLIVSIERPVKPMKPFDIQFHFNINNIENLKYSTNMAMNMGKYQFIPKDLGHGNYITNLTLPKCGSGNSLWYGKLEIKYKSGKDETVYFFYNLK